MPKSPRDIVVADAAEVEAQNRETLDRLAWAIASADGFALFFAKCNLGTQRHELMSSLEDRLQADGIPVARVRLRATDDPLEALTSPAQRDGVRAVFVEAIELLDADDPVRSALASLNLCRERYAQRLECPLVIWTTDIAVSRLAETAPDLFAWRSGVFEFRSPPPDTKAYEFPVGRTSGDRGIWDMPVAHREQRVEDLEGVLCELDDLPDTPPHARERARILLEIGAVLLSLSRYHEAVAKHQEALVMCRQLGDPGLEVRALSNLAVAHERLGQSQQATARYERAEALCQQWATTAGADAAREWAVVLHNLAGLAARRGDRERAVHLYGRSLALDEQIGNVQARAATMHNMARLLAEQGDLQRAMHLYREAMAAGSAPVRKRCARSLASLPLPDAVRALAATLRSDPDSQVREAAARGLGDVGDPGGVQTLEQAAKVDTNALVRDASRFALWMIRCPAALLASRPQDGPLWNDGRP